MVYHSLAYHEMDERIGKIEINVSQKDYGDMAQLAGELSDICAKIN